MKPNPAVSPGVPGNIPAAAIADLENEASGIYHGSASLVLFIRDGKPYRYTVSREQSKFTEAGGKGAGNGG
jgi:hypothetical protein